jgi:hypothetical protein
MPISSCSEVWTLMWLGDRRFSGAKRTYSSTLKLVLSAVSDILLLMMYNVLQCHQYRWLTYPNQDVVDPCRCRSTTNLCAYDSSVLSWAFSQYRRRPSPWYFRRVPRLRGNFRSRRFTWDQPPSQKDTRWKQLCLNEAFYFALLTLRINKGAVKKRHASHGTNIGSVPSHFCCIDEHASMRVPICRSL